MAGDVTLLEWEAPGPYRVAFSTRLGGVSEGRYESLNLGILTGDEPGRVVENRRRVCAAVGADPETATMAWQVHGARVAAAEPRGIVTPGTVYERCDGLWTDRPGDAMLLLAADCVPVALCRAEPNGRPGRSAGSGGRVVGEARLAVLHVGWRGLLGGIAEAGVRALRGGPVAAAIGPGIGPCCYEVGDDVARPFRAAFGDDVVAGRHLDLWSATERALLAAGCAGIERTDLCTSCDEALFFSHRRDHGRTGRQGVLAYVER